MSNNSPTCILSSTCLQQPPSHSPLVRTSSRVDSSNATTTATGPVRCGAAATLYCNSSGGGASSGLLLSNVNCQCGCCPINNRSTSPVHDNQDSSGSDLVRLAPPKSPKSSRSGWKTSKFFSKSMNSGEILRGLKKLSLTSSSSSNNNAEDQQQQELVSDTNKSFKKKLKNLKKRSSYGNDEVATDIEALDKASVVSKSGDNGKLVQDEGIVCKKEDLKALICSATKRLPLCSPRKKRALRQTKSASFEPPEDKSKKKEPVRRAGSEETRSRKSLPPAERDHHQVTPKIEKKVSNQNTVTIKEPITVPVAAPPNQQKVEPTPRQPIVTVEQAACASTVKWDDGNVIDVGLIGDAIESFLKGSMSTTEKDTRLTPSKMTFRKNSFEKKQ